MTRLIRKQWRDHLTLDNAMYLAIIASGFVLLSLFWNLGIKADDYLVLTWSRSGSFYESVKYQLENVNNRYFFFIFYRLLVDLFFDPENPFGWLFARVSFLLIAAAHTGTCLLGYRILRDLGVRAGVAAIFLPVLLFPFFSKGAVIWIGAGTVHVFGLFFFMLGAFFAMRRQRILFAIASTIALGCSEFVIFPFAFAAFSLLYRDWKHHFGLSFSKRTLKTVLGSVPSLFPPSIFVSIILIFSGFGSRAARPGPNPKIWEEPLKWPEVFWSYYLHNYQPLTYVKEHSFLIPLIVIAVLIAASKTMRSRLIVLMLFFLYVTSLFPLAFVGYWGFHSRLAYVPGLFFFSVLAAGVSFTFDRFSGLLSKKIFRWSCCAIAAAAIAFTAWFSFKELHKTTQFSAQAYLCVRDFLQYMVEETDNTPPRAILSCGFPNWRVGGENDYLGDWFSSYAMGVAYNRKEPVLLRSLGDCPAIANNWLSWKENRCPYEVRYRIVNESRSQTRAP